MASCVQKQAHTLWIWIAMDVTTRQVSALHSGDRSHRSATRLWAKMPHAYRQHAPWWRKPGGGLEGRGQHPVAIHLADGTRPDHIRGLTTKQRSHFPHPAIVLVFVVNQTEQERAEGVRRLLGCRARAGQHRLKMRVGAAGDGLTIRKDVVQW